jgi:hypothetical protein
MLISYRDLSDDAVYSLAKEWVVSNLSDVEAQPMLVEWTDKTIQKIKKGDLLIEFGEESQTVYLKTKEELNFTSSGANAEK